MSDGHTPDEFAVSDVEYNMVTTLSNLLQSEEVLVRYADDADEAGAAEIAALFHDLRDSNRKAARALRQALADHLNKS